MFHDGSNSYIAQGGAGDLYIQQNVNDKDLVFQCDNGSGGTTEYLVLNGGTTHAYFSNPGNVGIATTTPQRVLDVNVGGNSGVGASFAGTISAGEYQGIHFGYSEAGNANYRKSALVFERDDASTGDATGKIHILNSASGAGSATLADSRVTILKTGDVGIGTTSPVSSLNITTTKTVALDTAAKFLTLGLTVDDLTAGNTAGGGGGIAFRSKNTNAGTQIVFGAIDAIKESANVSDFRGSLRFFTNQNSTGIPLERMRIDFRRQRRYRDD